MKRKSISTVFILFCCVANIFAQGPVVKDPNPKPVLMAPDLTISSVIWRNKTSTAVIVVENIGTVKSGATTGAFSCRSGPTKEGYYITSGVQFYIPTLSPNQKKSITLDCQSSELSGATVDRENKVAESNEKNNAMTFAKAQ